MASYSIVISGVIRADFSISAEDSSGHITISGSITNLSSLTRYGCRLSVSFTNDNPWTRLGDATLAGGASTSFSRQFSKNGYSQIFCFVKEDGGHSKGGAYPIEAYVNPFSAKQLTINPTTITMGNALSISDSAGQGVTSTTHEWKVGNVTGDFSTGTWIPLISDFEPLCPDANYCLATFTTYSYGDSGSGRSDVNVRLNVPPSYIPSATHEYEYIDARNNALVAGVSKLRITIYPTVVPSDNSATIQSCVLSKVNSTNSSLTVNSFTKSGDQYTSVTLPSQSGVPSYVFSLEFLITDSRGNSLTYITNEFRVTNFVPPYVEITNLKRLTSETGKINISINSPSAAYLAQIKINNGTPVDVKNQLVTVTGGYTLEYDITGLSSGQQYTVSFIYQDTNMHNYGENPYVYSRLLSTKIMPLSLYDDGSNVAISFGEECPDSINHEVVANFASDAYIRYVINDTVNETKADEIFCPYPIGGVFMCFVDTDPNEIWKGTLWIQAPQSAFLLSADDNHPVDFEVHGEEEHTLTVDELPAHTHATTYGEAVRYGNSSGDKYIANDNNDPTVYTESTGGDQPHNNMPPYTAIYMWFRVE